MAAKSSVRGIIFRAIGAVELKDESFLVKLFVVLTVDESRSGAVEWVVRCPGSMDGSFERNGHRIHGFEAPTCQITEMAAGLAAITLFSLTADNWSSMSK